MESLSLVFIEALGLGKYQVGARSSELLVEFTEIGNLEPRRDVMCPALGAEATGALGGITGSCPGFGGLVPLRTGLGTER